MIQNVVLQTYNFSTIEMGPAIVIIGILALLLWVSVTFRNPLAIVMWGISVIMFILSSVLDFGGEFLWISLAVTAILVVIGVAVRAGSSLD